MYINRRLAPRAAAARPPHHGGAHVDASPSSPGASGAAAPAAALAARRCSAMAALTASLSESKLSGLDVRSRPLKRRGGLSRYYSSKSQSFASFDSLGDSCAALAKRAATCGSWSACEDGAEEGGGGGGLSSGGGGRMSSGGGTPPHGRHRLSQLSPQASEERPAAGQHHQQRTFAGLRASRHAPGGRDDLCALMLLSLGLDASGDERLESLPASPRSLPLSAR